MPGHGHPLDSKKKKRKERGINIGEKKQKIKLLTAFSIH